MLVIGWTVRIHEVYNNDRWKYQVKYTKYTFILQSNSHQSNEILKVKWIRKHLMALSSVVLQLNMESSEIGTSYHWLNKTVLSTPEVYW